MTISILASASSAGILVAKSSLLLGLGWGATRVLHRASAATRHAVWLTTIVGALLIPAVDKFSPISLRVLPAKALSSVAQPSAVANTELAPAAPRTIQAAALADPAKAT